MNIAKFKQGDLVKIDDKMPKCMSHFKCGCYAIIDQYDQYLKEGEINYALRFLPKLEYCAWYYESQLTFISHPNAKELIDLIEILSRL